MLGEVLWEGFNELLDKHDRDLHELSDACEKRIATTF